VVKPWVDPKTCIACESCLRWCPEGAISMQGDSAVLDQERCIGCGECLATCQAGAVRFSWRMASGGLQERMAEQAAGVVKQLRGKLGYLTFVLDVGKDCDCLASRPSDVLVKRAGILASLDPVAIDQASIDLVEEHLGCSLREAAYDIDWSTQLEAAEALGIGTREYRLQPVQA